MRTPTAAGEDPLLGYRALICDRDTKWSAPVRVRLSEPGIRVVQTPYQAPNANAYAGDDSTHGLTGRRIRRRPRLGGLLNYYERAA